MRRGLVWIVLLLALLAAYVALQRDPAPVGIGSGSDQARTSSSSPSIDSAPREVLDGAFPDRSEPQARPVRDLDAYDVADAPALPAEALATLRRIASGGPYPYRQDGGTFGNRERLLPSRPRGWYREYTVDTPRSRDRGARRIVTGGDPATEFFYTDDHYRSFRRIDPAQAGAR